MGGMDRPDAQPLDKDEPLTKRRLEDARQNVKEYAADLRAIMRKLRRLMN